MTGLAAHPAGTLVDRALELLVTGPQPSAALTRDVLGIREAPAAVAERLAVALLGHDPRVRRDPNGCWRLILERSGSPAIADVVFAVVDVETTGTNAARDDRVTEVSVVTVGPNGINVALDTLVNPGRPIPAWITRATRITDAMVQDAQPFDTVADQVLAHLAGRVFVAHNAPFDWRFLSGELWRTRSVRLDGPRLCTAALSRTLLPGLKSRGLDSVSRYFGIEIENRHRAGGDALATARVLTRLIELARDQGAETLDDLRGLSHRGRKRRRNRHAGPTSVDEG